MDSVQLDNYGLYTLLENLIQLSFLWLSFLKCSTYTSYMNTSYRHKNVRVLHLYCVNGYKHVVRTLQQQYPILSN